jgi:hypothetical protein
MKGSMLPLNELHCCSSGGLSSAYREPFLHPRPLPGAPTVPWQPPQPSPLCIDLLDIADLYCLHPRPLLPTPRVSQPPSRALAPSLPVRPAAEGAGATAPPFSTPPWTLYFLPPRKCSLHHCRGGSNQQSMRPQGLRFSGE